LYLLVKKIIGVIPDKFTWMSKYLGRYFSLSPLSTDSIPSPTIVILASLQISSKVLSNSLSTSLSTTSFYLNPGKSEALYFGV
jgi:hypothetical protein